MSYRLITDLCCSIVGAMLGWFLVRLIRTLVSIEDDLAAPVPFAPSRLDLLYGVTPMRPELICRILPIPWWRLDLRILEWMEEWDERFASRYEKWECTWCGARSDPPSGWGIHVCHACGYKGCREVRN